MLTKDIILLYDNTRPHADTLPQDLIREFDWEQLDHPSYSPDLVPNGYYLFLHLKKNLGGKHHDDDDEVKTTVLE
jgi:hypothetical protein